MERRCPLTADLVADIQLWRAATQVPPADLRPTGHMQSSLLARTWQLRLDHQLVAADNAQDQQWAALLAKRIPNVIKDSFMPSLVHRLENLDRAGFDATGFVRSAAAKGPLPDDHPAAALWWRILDELPQRPPNNSEQPTPAMARSGASKFRREPSSDTGTSNSWATPAALEQLVDRLAPMPPNREIGSCWESSPTAMQLVASGVPMAGQHDE
jgi:hypothetical protein